MTFKAVPVNERFWPNVDRRGPDDCWEWTAGRDQNGYGHAFIHGKQTRAHRVSYMLKVGSIPNGLFVLHHCDNPPCVNPAHLFLGTQADNNHDMMRKGRFVKPPVTRGERNPQAKVTLAQATEIRRRYAAGGVMQTTLATDFGISRTTVNEIICRRRRWKELSA